MFNSLFGWTNSATYGSVISYNAYWIVVILGFILLRWREKRGAWPLISPKKSGHKVESDSDSQGPSDLEKHTSSDNEKSGMGIKAAS